METAVFVIYLLDGVITPQIYLIPHERGNLANLLGCRGGEEMFACKTAETVEITGACSVSAIRR